MLVSERVLFQLKPDVRYISCYSVKYCRSFSNNIAS